MGPVSPGLGACGVTKVAATSNHRPDPATSTVDTMSDESPTPEISFADLGLGDAVLKALKDVGYETPSAIQAATIPPLLEARRRRPRADRHRQDRGVRAADPVPPRPQAEDAAGAGPAPTRELALQVCEAFEKYAAHLRGVHVLPVYGGQGYGVQLSALRRGVHIVVGTPAGSWTTSRRARWTSPSCASSSSTRPTRCSTWASPRTSRRFSPTPPRTRTSRCSPRPCPRRSGGSQEVPQRPDRDHRQEQDDDVGQHHPALPDGVLPAEGGRPHPDPRGRELRGDDRLRPHQERDRDPGREARPVGSRRWRSTGTWPRCSASARSTS